MMINQTQKAIILIAIASIVIMILYPPWVLRSGSNANPSTQPGPYALMWIPPERARFIDLYRLSIQFFGIFVIATGLCFVTGTNKKQQFLACIKASYQGYWPIFIRWIVKKA